MSYSVYVTKMWRRCERTLPPRSKGLGLYGAKSLGRVERKTIKPPE
jgi:hypothetical protein